MRCSSGKRYLLALVEPCFPSQRYHSSCCFLVSPFISTHPFIHTFLIYFPSLVTLFIAICCIICCCCCFYSLFWSTTIDSEFLLFLLFISVQYVHSALSLFVVICLLLWSHSLHRNSMMVDATPPPEWLTIVKVQWLPSAAILHPGLNSIFP